MFTSIVLGVMLSLGAGSVSTAEECREVAERAAGVFVQYDESSADEGHEWSSDLAYETGLELCGAAGSFDAALDLSRSCGTETGWAERFGGGWLPVCGDADGVAMSVAGLE
jgi:hypothetical protein